MRVSKLLFLSAALALFMSPAIANIQFHWTGVANGTIGAGIFIPPRETVFLANSLELIIEVTPKAMQSGHISYHSPRDCGNFQYREVCPLVDAPISYFFASVDDIYRPIRFFPGNQPYWGFGSLDIEVDLTPARLVSGTIDAYANAESDIHLVGRNGLFTADFNSDYPTCFLHCTGAQGIAHRNAIPEPATAALMGLAMLGLVVRKYVPGAAATVKALA